MISASSAGEFTVGSLQERLLNPPTDISPLIKEVLTTATLKDKAPLLSILGTRLQELRRYEEAKAVSQVALNAWETLKMDSSLTNLEKARVCIEMAKLHQSIFQEREKEKLFLKEAMSYSKQDKRLETISRRRGLVSEERK